ncbi:branched-chain amino acid ABC transporter permease [Limibaculum sp. M0105]|uniref:Branched-chain amino acid ABC transporter permease n=1 Tax=Thermohalobaculum xanthum TaxID=2753746 RepID=A0A8J7MBA4_9RHOB|nr:branched-chain amino acid ABC transporter permease [Thermohalobaculum xanthum]MBK0401077.1 branched-chain amino acid ABC transporter permease [Thermohalobaculum xanthum]
MSDVYLQALISGLMIGGVYALVAVGLTLIFGVMDIINFAHGEFLMFGMYGAFFASALFGIDPYLSAVMALPLFFAIGWAVQGVLIRPVVGKSHAIQILLTLGLSLLMQALAQFLFSADFQSLKVDYGSATFDLSGARVSYTRLAAFAISMGMCAALWVFLQRTDTGKALRACAEEHEGAQAVGIDIARMYKIAFGLGIACVAIAGIVMTPFFYVAPVVGPKFTLVAFVIVVLGGLGNIPGAVAGALIVGVVESVGALVMPSPSLKDLAVYVLFILVLLFRPQGLFGGKGA